MHAPHLSHRPCCAQGPLGLEAIDAALPASKKFRRARLNILLEVMESRKVVKTEQATGVVRWLLRRQ